MCRGNVSVVTKVGTTVTFDGEPVAVSPLVAGGSLAVVAASSPYEDVPSPTITCFAVMASWRDTTAPIGMFVTRLWIAQQPHRRTVNLVYADPEFRRHGVIDESDKWTSAAVVIGRWLFASGQLNRHSEDRTIKGEAWARAVGGELPPRDLNPRAPVNSEAIGAQILNMLNQINWPNQPLPAP
jgi:hypothetical protein